ncbi:ATP-binding cassette domain-containing protein [Pseudoduganella sp. FT26W]|uniref:Cyclolysin secretion/processing ATP-binding protein CyaB n=1 Tax=Duganella aquatilis TaxID=2666082 RepID=A0A844D3R1_9BURK|nr:ABC transporter ATP-binding protein [Duganella aquatilis]MRW87473.1 ATP-binding cassette domain-containing protein [Duganella aquatilis]
MAKPAALTSDLATEEALAGKPLLRRAALQRLLPLLRPVRVRIAAVVVLEILLVASIFVRPWFVRELVDHGLLRDGSGWRLDWPLLSWLGAGLAATWVARFALAGAARYQAGSAAIAVLNDLRVRAFTHVQALSVSYFDRAKAGRIMSRLDRDIDSLEPLLIQGPPELLSVVLRCVLAGVLLWHIAPPLFASLAIVIVPLAAGTWLFRRVTRSNWARVAEHRSGYTAHLVETVTGVQLLQQSGRQAANLLRYQALLKLFSTSMIRGGVTSGWFAPYTGLLSNLAMALLLFSGAHGLAQGDVSAGQIIESLFYVVLFLGPLQELGDLFERHAAGMASADRIFLLLDTVPEVHDRPQAGAPARVNGQVDFEQVRFAYRADLREPVIRGLDLRIRAGEMLAIVGPTGHGKSTLVQLLTRFYDVQNGRIALDGVDVRDYTQHNLRRHIGVVLQDNVLFTGSILDNLRLAAPDADDATLIAAARALGADEVLERLPHGYHTEVGASGRRLSHGQRQLVCLVRAYLADPAVLVLDEATSAVDMHSERRISRALRRLCAGRTSIVIAHRLATIRDADRIAVIRHGVVEELGGHEALLARDGVYAQLYASHERSAAVPAACVPAVAGAAG